MATELARHYRRVKRALRRGNLAEPFLAGRYSFSPYMACSHGCAYCDGRAEKYYVEGDFETDIVVRENLPALLQTELAKLREVACISVGSGISDAYQPPEQDEQIMRQAAEILASYDYPVTILTKSALVLRDLDLWKQVNRRGGFHLYVSLTFVDDELRRVFEPKASSVDERLEVLRRFKQAGCGVGVLAMPVLPYISDTDDNLQALLARLKQIGVEFVMPGGLTLRPGRQKDYFMHRIQDRFPHLVEAYKELYANELASGNPVYTYRASTLKRIQGLVAAAGFAAQVPHRLFRGRLPIYDELYVLLCHMSELYSDRGIDAGRLTAGLQRYRDWLIEQKRVFNRRRKLTQTQLEDDLLCLLRGGEMTRITANAKLSAFMRAVGIERKTFDYLKMRLVED